MGVRLPGPADPVTVIVKVPGEVCNINCHYCYEKRKPYPQAKMLSAETLRRFLRLAGGRPLALTLHGGEPLLMSRQRFAELAAELRAYPGKAVLGIQTNGLLLNDDWLDDFDRHWPGLSVGISLDGDRESNAHRVDYRNRETYDGVLRALRLLSDRGRPCALIMVVTRYALGRAEEILPTFAEFPCVKVVKLGSCLDYSVATKRSRTPSGQIILQLNPVGQGIPGWATTPQEYADFVAEAARCWRERGLYRRFLLEPAISVVRALSGLENDYTEFSDRKEPFILTLYPDGRIGASDHFFMPDGLLGHVDGVGSLDELLDLRTNPALHAKLDTLMQRCGACSHRDTCRGGSLADRVRYLDSPVEEAYCDSRRSLVDSVGRVLAIGAGGALSA